MSHEHAAPDVEPVDESDRLLGELIRLV